LGAGPAKEPRSPYGANELDVKLGWRTYRDLGTDHFDLIHREALVRRSVRRLERLGYEVSIKEVAA
jgi:hypothetical protein